MEEKYITIKSDWFIRLNEIAESLGSERKVDMQVLTMLLGYINSAKFIVNSFQDVDPTSKTLKQDNPTGKD